MAFDENNSSKYSPLAKEAFAETLGRIQHKPKHHPLLQIADSYIYAISRYRYDKKFGIYRAIRDANRIADFCIPEAPRGNMGVKYYCFDAQTKKPG